VADEFDGRDTVLDLNVGDLTPVEPLTPPTCERCGGKAWDSGDEIAGGPPSICCFTSDRVYIFCARDPLDTEGGYTFFPGRRRRQREGR
jgi:hypothetical protein